VSTVFGPVLGHWRATGERVFGATRSPAAAGGSALTDFVVSAPPAVRGAGRPRLFATIIASIGPLNDSNVRPRNLDRVDAPGVPEPNQRHLLLPGGRDIQPALFVPPWISLLSALVPVSRW